MNKSTFNDMAFKEKLDYVNQFSNLKTEEIAKDIGIGQSTLSRIFTSQGYKRVGGIYVENEKKQVETSFEDELKELLSYKENLIRLAKKSSSDNDLDFTVLEHLPKDKKTISFDINDSLNDRLDTHVKKKGMKKQALLNLLILNYLEDL